MMGTGFVPFTLDLKTWAARSANAPLPVMTRAYPRSLGRYTSKTFILRFISLGFLNSPQQANQGSQRWRLRSSSV